MPKNLIVDLDGTLTIHEDGVEYIDKRPRADIIEKLHEYKDQGFHITILTSRNMRTYDGDVEKIREFTLPIIVTWLDKHSIPYDQIQIGKPWCGNDGFYIDDKAIRPSEFARLSHAEIHQLLDDEKKH